MKDNNIKDIDFKTRRIQKYYLYYSIYEYKEKKYNL